MALVRLGAGRFVGLQVRGEVKIIFIMILAVILAGCQMLQFITCGDGPCPEYKICPIENKKVEIETIHRTETKEVKCGWFKNFTCLEWEETYQDEQGHIWKEMDSVGVPQ